MHHVWYKIHFQNEFTNDSFLVKITLEAPPQHAIVNHDTTQQEEGWTNINFIHKEKGWTREDVAYFFGVPTICNETKVGPLISLKGNNGSCCDLSMLISAVKLRKIFICEFVQNENIYVS
jgi:hypothetical protein